VIIMVWDGLRPDSVDPAVTPMLAELRDRKGVDFQNHHSVYPTFTMMNAAAFATGARSGHHGFYGNYEYQPGPSGNNAKGATVDFEQPFFSEDHAILQSLDAYYREHGAALLRVPTIFQLAQQAGLSTAVLGKAGPAFLQDYRPSSEHAVFLDENVVLPRSFGLELQAAGLPLPKNTKHQAYPEGPLELRDDNGDPTAPTKTAPVTLADQTTPDPRASDGSPHNARNAYMMRVFLEHVLPKRDPALSLIWLRNPDSTQHTYGPGTPNVVDALRHQDSLLGQLLETLARLGRSASTDVIVVSDHGHSSVAGHAEAFPLRALTGAADGHGEVGDVAEAGFIVSGDVRSAEWLRRAGFAHVYDGVGCMFDPVLVGLDARKKPLIAAREDAKCGTEPRFTTPSYKVPAGKLAPDAVVIAANGGSEYFYVPSHDPKLVAKLVTTLQERRVYGPVFVRALYGAVPGTLPLARIGMEGEQSVSPPMPDVVVSFDWDDAAVSAAAPGTPGSEHSSPQAYRGMHGSFSPRDVHNTLIAVGPDFRAGYRDELPSSSLDVARTVAELLHFALPNAEGRVLDEALAGRTALRYKVESFKEHAGPVALRRVCHADDLDCKRPLTGQSYSFDLYGQTLTPTDGSGPYIYLDKANATRAPAAAGAAQASQKD
jgi:arylsulfatase A-like enzyme